jgi:uncharacterized protein (TIGR02246 family)
MVRNCILSISALALACLAVGFMAGQDKTEKTERTEKTPKGADREADKAAIEKLIQRSVQAFNDRDAAAIVANWTAEGEYMRNDGQPIRGRAEIQEGYADFFKTLKGKSKVDVQTDGLRFTSADTAVSEVTLRLKNEQGEVIASSWRNTWLVREGGKWKVTMVHEWDRDDGLDSSLKELEWLVGTWHVADKGREVTTVYEWDENKTFIRGKYKVKEGNKVIESGTQMIGKDNAAGAIRSWVFQSDGGFGDGLWTREGKKWSVNFYGVTADGRELTATAIYIHVDANTYTWQSVDQAVDGSPIPDTKPIKVTRQK